MKLLHLIWLPFAYWVTPYKLANNALRGTLKHYGVNLNSIPNGLTEELSSLIIKRQKLNPHSHSVFKLLEDLHIQIDDCAITMKKIINHEYRFEYEFTPEVEEVKNIMLKHAIKKK